MMLKNQLYRIVLLTLLLGIYGLNLHYEQIPVNNGWGWDGKHYANLTVNFEKMASHGEIDSYQFQRILTPALIFYGCKWTGISLSENTVLSIYGYYNLILVTIGALLFFGWCSRLKISKPVETIGFAALFLNYAILKNTPYYPILTDTTVFIAGIVLMYWISIQHTTGKWILALVSPFVFPLFNLMILPLVVMPDGNRMMTWLRSVRFFTILKWLVYVLGAIAIMLVVAFPDGVLPLKYRMVFNPMLIPISIVCIVLYVFTLFRTLETYPIQSTTTHKRFPIIGLGLIVAVWAISKYIVLQNSIPEEGFTPLVFGLNVVQQTLYFPFAWIWAHITYFGPGIVLLLLWGRTLCHHLFKQSDGIILFALFSVLLMTGSESRQFMYCWPFWVWILVQVCSSLSITMPQAIAFVGLCLIQSKCWFPINTPVSFTDYDYSHFPNQRYFMNHGPFMSPTSYIMNIGAAIITTLLTWFIFWYEPSRKTTFNLYSHL